MHGLCATFELLGSIAEEISTFKALPFAEHVLPSKILLRRFRRLVDNDLLKTVPSNSEFPEDPGYMQVLGVVPSHAITMALAFEDDADNNEIVEALAARGVFEMPKTDLAAANAYYCYERVNNVRHESICAGKKQPPYGWRVCTISGVLDCECNYFYKYKFCCHLLYALQKQRKNFTGESLPPETFARNHSQRGVAAPRFDGVRRRSSATGRNVRSRQVVGRPLDLR